MVWRKRVMIIQTMRRAARRGMDPYNTVEAFAQAWAMSWRDRVRKGRA